MVISDTVFLSRWLLFNYWKIVGKENKMLFSFFIVRRLKTIMDDISVLVVRSL
jgi:hypothetical protein